jgi:hypothetical protein
MDKKVRVTHQTERRSNEELTPRLLDIKLAEMKMDYERLIEEILWFTKMPKAKIVYPKTCDPCNDYLKKYYSRPTGIPSQK